MGVTAFSGREVPWGGRGFRSGEAAALDTISVLAQDAARGASAGSDPMACTVQTVPGEAAADSLGRTLTREHIVSLYGAWGQLSDAPQDGRRQAWLLAAEAPRLGSPTAYGIDRRTQRNSPPDRPVREN